MPVEIEKTVEEECFIVELEDTHPCLSYCNHTGGIYKSYQSIMGRGEEIHSAI